MAFCNNCGAKLPDGVKFCTECGAPQTAPAPQTTPPVQDSYSPPVQQSYAPPAEDSYAPPAQQSYAPPADDHYAPPSQQSYAPPAEDSYSPPSQQSYAPPAEDSYSPPSQQSYAPPADDHYAPPSRQSYAPPAEDSYSPPSQQSYAPPAEDSYSPPSQQSYAPPAQDSYSPPSQQSYAPPAQDSYSPPSQQSYTPPTQNSYTPPTQQSYAAPEQNTYTPPTGNSGGYVPPAAPPKAGKQPKAPKPPKAPKAPKEPKAGGSKKGLLIGIIAAAVVVIAAVVVVVVVMFGGKDNPNAGRYEGISCTVSGAEQKMNGEWIQLDSNGKATFYILGEEFKGKWSLDGEKLTVNQSGDTYTGTLKNGTATIDFGGMVYTFQNKNASASSGNSGSNASSGTGSTTDKGDKDNKGSGDAGYWTLLRTESSDPENVMDETMVKNFRDLGIEFYIDLKEDGTGIFVLDYPNQITWSNGTINVAGEDGNVPLTYTVKDEQLSTELDGTTYIFVRGEGSAPEIDWSLYAGGEGNDGPGYEGNDGLSEIAQWWDGDWYGWWVIPSTSSSMEDMLDYYWDCCASIEAYADDTGYIKIWDTTSEAGECIAFADVSFGMGTTEAGCMMSESGSFFNAPIEHADWIIDPGASVVSKFDKMICIDGTWVDPEDENNWIRYYIFLRPWGMDWEDVRTGDTSDMLYEDMMPMGYDDWYLPLIEAGEEMPGSFDGAVG